MQGFEKSIKSTNIPSWGFSCSLWWSHTQRSLYLVGCSLHIDALLNAVLSREIEVVLSFSNYIPSLVWIVDEKFRGYFGVAT